ncbi:ABC transporter permease [Spirillospora albida]|uniref:ABC transporter permease n=1 Tax=Spirillospora albida TaxID=58123 RepID=UPI0004BF7650|nr:ABC transporter permease [Spirillospora albida]
MAAFLLRRLVRGLVLVLLASSLAYLLAAYALRPRAELEGRTPRPPEAVIDAQLTRHNLNDRTPLADRFRVWATGVAHGSFGRTREGEPVDGELWRRLGVSARLLLPGTVLGCVLGVLLGAYAAIRHGGAADHAVTFLGYLLLAAPVFVLAVLLQTAAAEANDATGLRLLTWVGEPPGGGPLEAVRHAALPTATIALAQAALVGRYQRALMLDVLHADYVRTARARGLRRRDALLRHGLRVALVPMTAHAAATSGPVLFGGVCAERVFGRHGLGAWLVEAIARGDVHVAAAVTCLAACAVVLTGLAADVLSGILDPRVRAAC